MNLELKNVTRAYGSFKALDDVTVTIPEGLPATFAWRGAERPLKPGANNIDGR